MGNATSSIPKERIAIAVDDSSVSADTVAWAASHVLKRGQEVHLVQVVDSSLSSQATANAGECGLNTRSDKCEADPTTLDGSRQYLAKLRDTVLAQSRVGADHVKLVPLPARIATSADIGRALSEYAAEQKADAVIIGSRGLGAFRRRLLGLMGLGSVSDYVAHAAPCTVFIHKAA